MKSPPQDTFDIDRSPLKDVYLRFGTHDPGELQDTHFKEDQRLMKSGKWDYKNQSLRNNQIKNAIERVGINRVHDEKESRWIRNILWLWYHHAIGCALWRYGDLENAQRYAEEAFKLQPRDHPNKITRLLYYLTHDNLKEAEAWTRDIADALEKDTAISLLDLYKKGDFLKSQVD